MREGRGGRGRGTGSCRQGIYDEGVVDTPGKGEALNGIQRKCWSFIVLYTR